MPWVLILLLCGGFADQTSAQIEAPLRVKVEAEADRTGTYEVAEGDSIRILLTPIGGRSGDPAVEVRWQLFATHCDGPLPDENPIQEGLTLVQAGDPERVLEVPTPDDWAPQSTNRCLWLAVDFPGLAATAGRYAWLYTLLDNEYLFADGVVETLGGPGLQIHGSYSYPGWGMVSPNRFVPTADGGAYFVSDIADPRGSTTSILRRIRPDLTLDPEYRAETPDGSEIIAVAPVPAGGTVALVQREVGGEHLAEVVRLDGRGVRNAAYTANATVSLAGFSPHLLQATDEGGAYLADHRRIVLLTPDGTVDLRFREPGFIGDLMSLVRQDERLYALGSFSQVEGLGTNRFGAFRIGASGGTDPGFAVILGTNQTGISQLVELGDGRIVTHGAPLLNLHANSGITLANLFKGYSFTIPVILGPGTSARAEWHALARLGDGSAVGSSWDRWCSWGCGERTHLESIDAMLVGLGLKAAPPEGLPPLPGLANDGYFGPTAVYAAGDYLWLEEFRPSPGMDLDPIGEYLTYRRVRVTGAPVEGFGLEPSRSSALGAHPHHPISVVRRFGSSARRTQLEVRISPLASDPPQDLPSFSVPLTFEPGETEKEVSLPDGTRLVPGSVALFRTTLQPSPQGPIKGAATADCFVVGPSLDEARPDLGMHRFGSGILNGAPIFRLTGRPGSYWVQYSVDGVTWKGFATVELSSESPTVFFNDPTWIHDQERPAIPGSEMLLLRAVQNP